MTVASVHPLTHDWWVLDRSYQRTALGPDITAFLDMLELANKSRAWVDQCERTLARLASHNPNVNLRKLTDAHLGRVLLTWPPGSRVQRKAVLSKFYQWAIRTRRVTVNQTQYLPEITKPPRPPINVFTDVEEELLLGLPLIDSALMCILLDTGIRKEGARNLRVRDIRPESRFLIVEKEKYGSGRVVVVTNRLRAKLADLILLEGLNDDDYYWYDRPGGARHVRRSKPIGDSAFHRGWWVRCLKEAGVAYRKPHTTRHTYATGLRRKGAGLDDIQKMLGHKHISTTEIYQHGTVWDIAERLAALDPEQYAD